MAAKTPDRDDFGTGGRLGVVDLQPIDDGAGPAHEELNTDASVADAEGELSPEREWNGEGAAAVAAVPTSAQHINPEALLVLAKWHECRADDLLRAAANAETHLWRSGCERRAAFHRMSGDYLRELHAALLELRRGGPQEERESEEEEPEILLPSFLRPGHGEDPE